MAEQSSIRKQANTLLGLSNSIFYVAAGGCWEEMTALEKQRTVLSENLLGALEASGPDLGFVIGAIEHVRVVEELTRLLSDWTPADDEWPLEISFPRRDGLG
jgi:hypothetical protein